MNFKSTFEAFLTTNQSVSEDTQTKVQCNSEIFDTASAYDTSNSKVTVPSGQGGKGCRCKCS